MKKKVTKSDILMKKCHKNCRTSEKSHKLLKKSLTKSQTSEKKNKNVNLSDKK